MTKKAKSFVRILKKQNPKENHILNTFKKLNRLSITSINTIEDTSEMEKVTDQIENCNKILKYLKQRKQEIISAQTNYFNKEYDKIDNNTIQVTTNLSDTFEKDLNYSDLNSSSQTPLNSNSIGICNQISTFIEPIQAFQQEEKELFHIKDELSTFVSITDANQKKIYDQK